MNILHELFHGGMMTATEAEAKRLAEKAKHDQHVKTLELSNAVQQRRDTKKPNLSELSYQSMAYELKEIKTFLYDRFLVGCANPEFSQATLDNLRRKEAAVEATMRWLMTWHNQEKEADAANKAALKANESQVIQ